MDLTKMTDEIIAFGTTERPVFNHEQIDKMLYPVAIDEKKLTPTLENKMRVLLTLLKYDIIKWT